MPVPILVITPAAQPGEQIIKMLQETGDYQPTLLCAPSAAEAVAAAASSTLAIVDARMDEAVLNNLGTALRQARLPMILISPEAELAHNLLAEGLAPQAVLPGSFSAPELLQQVASLLRTPAGEPASPTEETFFWLAEPSQANPLLQRLFLEINALAALISCRGEVLACAGQVSPGSAVELAQAATQYWEKSAPGRRGDLARFIRLQDGSEYMLYITALQAHTLLTLAFATNMPFSKMRTQAGLISQALVIQPVNASVGNQFASLFQESQPLPPAVASLSSEGSRPGEGDEEIIFRLEAAPDMPVEPLFSPELVPDPFPRSQADVQAAIERLNEIFQPEETPSTSALPVHLESGKGALPRPGRLPEKTSQPMINHPAALLQPVETTPEQPPNGSDPLSQIQAQLSYTCVLVTRLPQRVISSELKKILEKVMPHIHLAFGWRLETLSISSEYLLWVTRAQPEVAPIQVVQAVRCQASRHIFEQAPVEASFNPSGDFWAPGCLLLTFTPDETRLGQFIHHTRCLQGLA